jgi:tripartite-type tricarboxylate transporter receptor subunit TctC
MGYASVIGVLPLIKSGRLRAIAVTSRERVEALPGVPTLAETPSLAGYDLNNWAGLFAPAGLPRPVLQTLHDAAIQVVSSSEWQKPILEAGAIPSPGTPQQFAAFIAAESKKFGQIIKETNITVDG